jgi:hypothetical protein
MHDGITKIADFALYGCTKLNNMGTSELPNIRAFGISAFEGCASLGGINFVNGTTEVPASAFKNCTALGSVTFADSITTVGDYAFQGCTNLYFLTLSLNITT